MLKKIYAIWIISMAFSMNLVAQTGRISGKISTSDLKPASHVNIFLKEVRKGSVSAEDGSYELPSVQPGKYTLVVSFVGLQTQQKQIQVLADQTSEENFVLVENENELTEIVVTGSKGLNEKTVSAGKIAIKPMDLPQSIMVIGKNVLERQQTLRLSDALANANGVYVMGTTGGGQEEIAARGYAFGSNNTFKNGARYNNGAMPEMSGIEKVEIMKGSSAILFGNVAPGGVLNLVTKKPKFERGGEISLRAGSYDFYKPAIDVYGALNRNVAYRLNTTYEKANSFRDVVNAERYYVNPSLLIKAGRKTEVLLEGDYLNDRRTSDFGVGAINYSLIDIPRNRFIGAEWAYYKTIQKSATATITHEISSNWKITSITSFQQFQGETFGTTRPNSGSLPNNAQFIKANGDWVRGLQRSRTEESYYLTQLDLTGQFKTGNIAHTFLAGADADRYSTDAHAFTYANPAIGNRNVYDTINIFDLNKFTPRNDIPDMTATTITNTPVARYGVYIQDLVSVTDKLKVLAGARYTYMEAGGGEIQNLQTKTVTSTSKSTDMAVTPRFGIVYQPAKTISIFTSYANSFTLNTGTDIYLKPLEPSYINQYEAGIKTELFGKLISANLTAYRIVNSNLAQIALVDADGNSNSNSNIRELAGEVTSKGIELDVMTKPIAGFSIIGGYSFNDTRYTRSNTFIEGSKLRYNPAHTANMSVYYTFPERSPLKRFNAGLIAYYVGERMAGRSTRIQVPNDTYKLIEVPSYTFFDASIGYTANRFSVRVKLSNILNEYSFNVHDDNSINPIPPRQVAGTVTFKL